MAPVYAAFGIGTALGPAIGGVLGAAYGLNAPFMFVGSAMISAAALNFLTVRETRPAKQGCGRSVSDQGAEGGGVDKVVQVWMEFNNAFVSNINART